MAEPTGALAETVLDRAGSFTRFFLDEHGRLIRMLSGVAGGPEEAEELAQEAFARVWARWDRVRALEEPAGYLYRVATNALHSRQRHAQVVRRCPVDRGEGRDETSAVDAHDELRALLGRLTERERAALVLTGILGYSSAEAGAVLGIEASTVRVLTTRARAAMRAYRTPSPD